MGRTGLLLPCSYRGHRISGGHLQTEATPAAGCLAPAVAGVEGWRSEEGQVFDTHGSDTVVKISPQRGNWQCCGGAEVSSHGSLVQRGWCHCQLWGQGDVHHTRTRPGIPVAVPGCEAPAPLPSFTIPFLAACRKPFGMGVSETALVYEHSKPRVVWGQEKLRRQHRLCVHSV